MQAHNKHHGNRSFDEITNDLEEARERCDGVVLTGGEVTIRDDILDIIRKARALGYSSIQLQSNGRMFASKSFCKECIRAGANEFAPALHGYCADQHDFLTRCEGSFNQTVKGIRNLHSLGQRVITNTVVVKPNVSTLPSIAMLLVKLGVHQYQMAFVHPTGNAWKYFDSIVPSISMAAPYIKQSLQVGIDNGVQVMAEAMPYCLMEEYQHYIAERRIPSTEIRSGTVPGTDDFEKQRREQGKGLFPQCKRCTYNDVCEGPWKEYPQVRGYSEFIPHP